MQDQWFDAFSREISAGTSRRDVLRKVVGAVAAVTAAGVVGAANAGADELSGQKKTCKDEMYSCKGAVSQFCYTYYPGVYGLCKRDLNRCCKKAGKCKITKARRCLNNSGW